nr:hypothetical protein [Tanacetum cinerariifolium]
MPVPLVSFDVIIGMDWLREYHSVIFFDEKIVRVSFENETLIFQGKRNDQEAEDKSEEKRLEDVSIVRDFPKVLHQYLLKPLCTKCNYHHTRKCAPKYNNCKKYGHATHECRVNVNNNNNNNNRVQNMGTCSKCGEPRYFKKNCLKLKNNGNDGARGKAYVLGEGETNPESNIVTSMFLLNNRYASILFDTGADRSFVSTAFSALIILHPLH